MNIQYYIGKAAIQIDTLDKMIKVFQDYGKHINYKVNTLDLKNANEFIPTLCSAVSDAVRVVNNPNDNGFEIDLAKLNKVHDFRVHCGIDFGTAGSGYAYVLSNDKTQTVHLQDCGPTGNLKMKTNILFDPNGNFYKFGDEASKLYTGSNDYKDYLFFERFKMKLYDKKIDTHEVKNDDSNESKNNNNDNNGDGYDSDDDKNNDSQKITHKLKKKLKAVNGKELETEIILTEALRYFDIFWIVCTNVIWCIITKVYERFGYE